MTDSNEISFQFFKNYHSISPFVALLKAQVSLQLGKVFSSDNGVSVSIMYSYMY